MNLDACGELSARDSRDGARGCRDHFLACKLGHGGGACRSPVGDWPISPHLAEPGPLVIGRDRVLYGNQYRGTNMAAAGDGPSTRWPFTTGLLISLQRLCGGPGMSLPGLRQTANPFHARVAGRGDCLRGRWEQAAAPRRGLRSTPSTHCWPGRSYPALGSAARGPDQQRGAAAHRGSRGCSSGIRSGPTGRGCRQFYRD